ncbi:MAG: hypothetical protein IJW83_01215 [Clostridia bacterium]|nr:hypothetical protein [Clostridia bacterium]
MDKQVTTFEDARLTIIPFDAEDIITTSGTGGIYVDEDGNIVLPTIPFD